MNVNRVKVLVTACFLLSASPYVQGQSVSQQIVLTAGEEPVVLLAFNENLIVEMQSNPSTGYRWDANQRSRERRCYRLTELTEIHDTAESAPPVLIGAPITQKWSVSLDPDFPCQNDVHISWTYHRPWEPSSSQDMKASLLLRTLSQ